MIMACGSSVYWFILQGVVGGKQTPHCYCMYHIQYAAVEEDNEKFLSYKDLVCGYLKLVNDKDNSEFINAIAKIADTTRNG